MNWLILGGAAAAGVYLLTRKKTAVAPTKPTLTKPTTPSIPDFPSPPSSFYTSTPPSSALAPLPGPTNPPAQVPPAGVPPTPMRPRAQDSTQQPANPVKIVENNREVAHLIAMNQRNQSYETPHGEKVPAGATLIPAGDGSVAERFINWCQGSIYHPQGCVPNAGNHKGGMPFEDKSTGQPRCMCRNNVYAPQVIGGKLYAVKARRTGFVQATPIVAQKENVPANVALLQQVINIKPMMQTMGTIKKDKDTSSEAGSSNVAVLPGFRPGRTGLIGRGAGIRR